MLYDDKETNPYPPKLVTLLTLLMQPLHYVILPSLLYLLQYNVYVASNELQDLLGLCRLH
jgi:hypothetical protein